MEIAAALPWSFQIKYRLYISYFCRFLVSPLQTELQRMWGCVFL
jgi:hypothetical protein